MNGEKPQRYVDFEDCDYDTVELEEKEEEDEDENDFDYEDCCDCCVKGWSKANEFGRCVCRCSRCRELLRNCRYKCFEIDKN